MIQRTNIRGPTLIATALIALSLPSVAAADITTTFNFGGLTWNNNADTLAGQAQLVVDVSGADWDATTIGFTFWNLDPPGQPMFISEIYFYDGAFTDAEQSGTVTSSAGVSFSPPATPPNLPGYSGPPVDLVYSTGADPPSPDNGINPGEWLTIPFALANGFTYLDVVNDLHRGDFVIGIHVQGFTGGGSESFITIIPAPGAAILGLIGLGLVGRVKRRFS